MARRSKDNAIDWDAIEKQYRLGTKSNKQLGEEFDVHLSSIARRAEKFGWVVDKSDDVEAVRNSLLIQAASGNANPNATPSALEIQAAGQAQAGVVGRHQASLDREDAIADKVLAQITDALDATPGIGEVIDFVRKADPDGDLAQVVADMLRKTCGRGSIVDDFKKVVETKSRIRKDQREAHGIDKTGDKVAVPYEAMLLGLGRKVGG